MLSVLVVIVLAVLTKKATIGLLVGYALVILAETIVFRVPTTRLNFQSRLFWSYAVWDIQSEQIIANVLAYIPVGLISGKLWKWKGLLVGMGLSITTEFLQLVTHRGLCEFDDLFNNFMGTVTGVILYFICVKIINTVVSIRGNHLHSK